METQADHTTRHRPLLAGGENELSLRYLRMLERWLPAGVELFDEWDRRPRSGHFLSGAHWYGLETSGPAFALAVAASAPDLDTTAAGVSREQLQEMSLAAIRYLCFTHDTGPADCVRPDHGLGDARNFGTKWGERGLGFFKESQCGRTTAPLVAACMLLGDRVDDETRRMVAAMQADYLARFGDMPPRSGIYIDTQMEENGWTAEGLTAAHLFLERHPQAGEWDAHTRRWMFSTCAAPQDAKNAGAMDGSTIARHTHKTVTALPDFWAENHGMVHPSYTAAGVKFTLYISNLLGLWDREVPPQLLWNRDRVYGNLKRSTDGGGYLLPMQGMDWPYLPAVGHEMIHAVASVFFDDAEAAALQRHGLEMAERRQEGNDGRLVNTEVAQQTREKDRATILREAGIAEIAHAYLFHRLYGAGADPLPLAEVESRLAGVRHYPHAGVIHQRHAHGQTSLSWRNVIMALPLTSEGIYTIAPARDSWLARPVVRDEPDSQNLQHLRIVETPDAFAAAIRLHRCQDSLDQQILFAGLPDGRTLSWERIRARRACHLEALEQGFLRITNETFPALNNGCRGERVIYHAGATSDDDPVQTTYRGWIGSDPKDDIVDDLGSPAWLNIDDRLGIRLPGDGLSAPARTEYRNRHHYEAYQVIADDLVVSMSEPRDLTAGETAGTLTALLCPGQPHEETAKSAFLALEDGDAVALLTDDFLTAVSFGDDTAEVCFQGASHAAVPIFSGVTAVGGSGQLQFHLHLIPGQPILARRMMMASVEGECRLEGTPNGLYATALSEDCSITVHQASTHDIVRHLSQGEVTFFESN